MDFGRGVVAKSSRLICLLRPDGASEGRGGCSAARLLTWSRSAKREAPATERGSLGHTAPVPRRVALIAACVAALLILPGLGQTPLVDWDESIYAAVSLGVLQNGPFHLEWNGERYDRKPPLLFW